LRNDSSAMHGAELPVEPHRVKASRAVWHSHCGTRRTEGTGRQVLPTSLAPRPFEALPLSEGELKGIERRGMMGSAVWATMI